MVEFDVHDVQKIKLFVHIAQAAVMAIAWILEIVTFRSAASIDGRPGWYFGLVRSLTPPNLPLRFKFKREKRERICG